MLQALSIKPLEGSRLRLRRTRSMGIQSIWSWKWLQRRESGAVCLLLAGLHPTCTRLTGDLVGLALAASMVGNSLARLNRIIIARRVLNTGKLLTYFHS